MVALSYLKHVHDPSDEAVVTCWVENPFRQWFFGFAYLRLHQAAIDPSLRSHKRASGRMAWRSCRPGLCAWVSMPVS